MFTSPKLHISIFALVIIIVTILGAYFYDSVQQSKKREAYSNLSTLANLKSNEIVKWVDAKTSDADYLYSNKNLQRLFRNYLIGPNVYTRNEIKEIITAFIAKSDYTDVILVTNSGKPISFFNKSVRLSSTEENDIHTCRKTKLPLLSSLYSDSLGNIIMNSCIPLVDKWTRYSFGVLLLRINPAQELFPLISTSPEGTSTAESFLVRRDGDSVLFLNTLKYRKNSALKFKLPISLNDLPAAKAVKGYKGIFEGIDYRGTRVLADLDQIPGTKWFIISKIDLNEVYSPIRKQTVFILTGALGFIFIIGLILYSLWNSEKIYYLNKQLIIEKEKNSAELQLLEAQSLAHVGSWELELETNKLKWSDEVYRIFGLIPNQFPAAYEGFLERIHPDDREKVNYAYTSSISEGRDVYEIDHRIIKYDSNEIRFVHEKCEHHRNNSGTIIRSVGMVQDITDRKLAEEALLISEERFAKAFSANPNALAISRLDNGKILEVNDTFLKLFGFTYEETIGRTSLELDLYVNPDDRKKIMSKLTHGGFRDQEIKVRLKSGEQRITLFSAEQLHMTYGESILTIIQDITLKKQSELALRESESRLAEAQQLARLGFYVLDLNTGLMDLSEEMYKIFEIKETDKNLSLEDLLSYIHQSDTENFKVVLRDTILSNKIIDHEFRIETTRGIKHLLSNNKPILNSEEHNPKVFGTVMDITERKQAQLALEKTLEELRRSNKDLEQFAYTASHDLQEPIRMVKSYAQLFEYTNSFNDSSREWLKYIVQGAGRMQDLVDGLLKYSRLSTKDQDFATVDCHQVLCDVLKDFKVKIQEECAVINTKELPVVKGNATQLRQLFQNLIHNSLKFRGENPVKISICSERRNSHWLFAVRDNGIGIDPRFFEKIFIMFQRLNDREQYPGTGIGLAICKKIVQRHGGEIWVESEPGMGSTFYFTLPAGV